MNATIATAKPTTLREFFASLFPAKVARSELDACQAALTQTQAQLAASQATLDAVYTALGGVQARLAQSRTSLDRVQAEAQRLIEENIGLCAANAKLIDRNKALEARHNNLIAHRSARADELSKVRCEYAQLEADFFRLKSRFEELIEEHGLPLTADDLLTEDENSPWFD